MQQYRTGLWSRTLASTNQRYHKRLTSMVDDVHAVFDVIVKQTAASNFRRFPRHPATNFVLNSGVKIVDRLCSL